MIRFKSSQEDKSVIIRNYLRFIRFSFPLAGIKIILRLNISFDIVTKDFGELHIDDSKQRCSTFKRCYGLIDRKSDKISLYLRQIQYELLWSKKFQRMIVDQTGN